MDVDDDDGVGEERAIELLDEVADRWRHRDGASLTLATRDHHVIALVMFGLTTHAVNIAASIVTLYRAEELAAIPSLARQVLELGTTAVWVELGGRTAAEALMAEQSRQQLNELADFVRLGMTGGEAAGRIVEADKAWFLAHRGGRYFKDRCDELEGGPLIYAVYRAASEHSHATTAVVDDYLHEPRTDSAAPVALRYTPRTGADPWLSAALTMVVHAWLAFDRLEPGHPSRTWLRSLARELGITPRVQHSAKGLTAQRQREQADRSRRRSGAQRPERNEPM